MSRWWTLLRDVASTVVIAGAAYLAQRRIGLNLHDEGFLWYGARQTARGEVPVRDFQSYDPGRYDWCAAFMRVRHDEGILTLRLACFAFAGVGVALHHAISRRLGHRPFARDAWAAIACVWFFPKFHTFDSVLPLLSIWSLTALAQHPRRTSHFTAGVTIGAAGYVGVNHGAYHLAAYALARASRRSLPRAAARPPTRRPPRPGSSPVTRPCCSGSR